MNIDGYYQQFFYFIMSTLREECMICPFTNVFISLLRLQKRHICDTVDISREMPWWNSQQINSTKAPRFDGMCKVQSVRLFLLPNEVSLFHQDQYIHNIPARTGNINLIYEQRGREKEGVREIGSMENTQEKDSKRGERASPLNVMENGSKV